MNPLDRSSLLLSTAAQALADFLRIDLEVGFTFADLAMRNGRLGHAEAFERNMHNAEKVIAAVFALQERVRSDETRKSIADRCAELRRIVTALQSKFVLRQDQ